MTNDKIPAAPTPDGGSLTASFWDAASRHELIIQHCTACGHFQFYPRPFCLACDAESFEWQPVSGQGTIMSKTTVRLEVTPESKPPYVVAIVQLVEGPTLLTNMANGTCQIGNRVSVTWRERPDAPPFPVFEPVQD